MPTLTRFTVRSYALAQTGDLIADEPRDFGCPHAAASAAKMIAKCKDGVVAYSWIGDPRTGEMGKVSVLYRFGVLPKYAAMALGLEYYSV